MRCELRRARQTEREIVRAKLRHAHGTMCITFPCRPCAENESTLVASGCALHLDERSPRSNRLAQPALPDTRPASGLVQATVYPSSILRFCSSVPVWAHHASVYIFVRFESCSSSDQESFELLPPINSCSEDLLSVFHREQRSSLVAHACT